MIALILAILALCLAVGMIHRIDNRINELERKVREIVDEDDKREEEI